MVTLLLAIERFRYDHKRSLRLSGTDCVKETVPVTHRDAGGLHFHEWGLVRLALRCRCAARYEWFGPKGLELLRSRGMAGYVGGWFPVISQPPSLRASTVHHCQQAGAEIAVKSVDYLRKIFVSVRFSMKSQFCMPVFFVSVRFVLFCADIGGLVYPVLPDKRRSGFLVPIDVQRKSYRNEKNWHTELRFHRKSYRNEKNVQNVINGAVPMSFSCSGLNRH